MDKQKQALKAAWARFHSARLSQHYAAAAKLFAEAGDEWMAQRSAEYAKPCTWDESFAAAGDEP